jgi:hypothetical protein
MFVLGEFIHKFRDAMTRCAHAQPFTSLFTAGMPSRQCKQVPRASPSAWESPHISAAAALPLRRL